MSNRDTLFGWIKNELCPYGHFDEYAHITADSNPPSKRTNVNLYSHDYCYHITCTEDGYLGSSCSCRKPRAGEDWTRGHDLPDGRFNRKTWNMIKHAIMRNEFVKIAKKQRSAHDEASTEELSKE